MKDIFIQIARDAKEYLCWLKYKKNLPKNPMHDDIYIVEFPKSGITWFSFVLINIQNITKKIPAKATFYNVSQHIIDIHQTRGAFVNRNSAPVFIKSHSAYNPFYYSVIYLIRNPFDVMVSYYNFSYNFGYKENFEVFLKDAKKGLSAWKKHVNSWNYKRNDDQRIHFVRYEDVKRDTVGCFNNILLNLGWEIDSWVIEKAVEMSAMKNMILSEDHYKKFNKNYSMTFVGSVNKKKKADLFTDNLKNYLIEILHDELLIFYPELIE